MATASRPILTLKAREPVDSIDDRTIALAVYDVLLPCRRYLIENKVAVLGRVSLNR